MTDLIATLAAMVLAGIIVTRVICVVYLTSLRHHAHAWMFLGFGYSYVALGAGAILGAVALGLDRHDLAELALWVLLAGSCGLILFDRRAKRCWMVTDCPIETQRDKF